MVVKLERIGIFLSSSQVLHTVTLCQLNVADAISGCIFRPHSLSLSLRSPQSSFRFYTVAFLSALLAESPAVPEETNGDRERHSKAPAFKDLKGGDRRERGSERAQL